MIFNEVQKDTTINDLKTEVNNIARPTFKSIAFDGFSITKDEVVTLATITLEPGFYHFSTYLSGTNSFKIRVMDANTNTTSIIIDSVGSIFFTMYRPVTTTYKIMVTASETIPNNVSPTSACNVLSLHGSWYIN